MSKNNIEDTPPDPVTSNTLDYSLKLLGIIVTIISIVIGVYKFLAIQEQNAAARTLEASKPYFEKKLKWCEEATETAAIIATSDKDSKQRKEKEQRFEELYWGVMGLVENDEVEDAMINFYSAIRGESPLGKDVCIKVKGNSDIQHLSLCIAYACRKEMSKNWSPVWSF